MTTRSRARALLILWSALLLAPALAAAIALLCCHLPIHVLIHQGAGMGACNHEAPSLEERSGTTAGLPPSPPPPPRLIAVAPLEMSAAALISNPSGSTRRCFLPWADSGPPPDQPTQAKLSTYRI